MKKAFFTPFYIFILFFLTTCATVPITGRKQLSLVPSSQLLALSEQTYSQVLQESRLSTNQAQVNQLKGVGSRLSRAVEGYLRENNLSSRLGNFNWEFNLIESDQVNAWAMPGGKIAFYTGILPITKHEAGMAVVMAHEVSHVIARHGGERMSQGLLAQLGGVALGVAMQNQPQLVQQLAATAFGLGVQIGVLLPFSRKHEKEADILGLYFMTMAGYDPMEAPELWKRMDANSSGQRPPKLLATHPHPQDRVAYLQKLAPRIKAKYYNKSSASR